jgi:integrase
MKFTDRWVERLRPTGKREKYWDDAPHGAGSLGLRMSATGNKSWVFRIYDKSAGKDRWITLGTYPEIPLAQARVLARGVSPSTIALSSTTYHNPSSGEGSTSDELLFSEFATVYLEKWAKIRKKSWKEDERILQRDVLPHIGSRPINSITRKDIVAILDRPIERGSLIQTNRVYALLHKIFSFAMERSVCDHHPCHGLRKPTIEQKRDRILNDAEIVTLLTGLGRPRVLSVDPGIRHILLFQLATASRSGEVTNLEWSEIQEDRWILPKEKSKNKVARILPLPQLAKKLLDLQDDSAGSYVFASHRTDRPYHGTSVSHAVKRIAKCLGMEDFCAHDLRRTAASGIASLGFSREVIKKILNHVDNDVTAIYDRHSYDAEKLQALTAWNDRLCGWIREIDPNSPFL